MGEAKRRRQIDPSYGTVPAALKELLTLLQSAYADQYSKVGRNVALIDEGEDTIQFITLNNLIEKAAVVKLPPLIIAALIELLQTYDPTRSAILLHLSWNFSDTTTKLTCRVRQLAFNGSTWHPAALVPTELDVNAGAIEFMQRICLAVSQVEHTAEFEFDNTQLDSSSSSSITLSPTITVS